MVQPPFRFRIATLMIVVAVVAVFLALSRWIEPRILFGSTITAGAPHLATWIGNPRGRREGRTLSKEERARIMWRVFFATMIAVVVQAIFQYCWHLIDP